MTDDIHSRVTNLESILPVIATHMSKEDSRDIRIEQKLTAIYDLIRDMREKGRQDDDVIKKEILDHVKEYYATKTEIETLNTKVESSRTFAIGVSAGISAIIALVSFYLSLKGAS